MPPQYRVILVLRDMESLTDEEVAEITGLRPGTVRVRLHGARLFVQKLLANAARNSRSAKRPMVRPAISNPKPSVKRRASCKALFAQLSDYLDEQLDDSVCEKLEQHFDGCEPCKMFLASLESTIEQLRRGVLRQRSRQQTPLRASFENPSLIHVVVSHRIRRHSLEARVAPCRSRCSVASLGSEHSDEGRSRPGHRKKDALTRIRATDLPDVASKLTLRVQTR